MENNIILQLLQVIYPLLIIIGGCKVFTKMGEAAWKALIPFYNEFIVYKKLYGNGWRFLLTLVPIYGIYVYFKKNIDWADRFDRGTGFGIGMALISGVFFIILGFGSDEFEADISDANADI